MKIGILNGDGNVDCGETPERQFKWEENDVSNQWDFGVAYFQANVAKTRDHTASSLLVKQDGANRQRQKNEFHELELFVVRFIMVCHIHGVIPQLDAEEQTQSRDQPHRFGIISDP